MLQVGSAAAHCRAEEKSEIRKLKTQRKKLRSGRSSLFVYRLCPLLRSYWSSCRLFLVLQGGGGKSQGLQRPARGAAAAGGEAARYCRADGLARRNPLHSVSELAPGLPSCTHADKAHAHGACMGALSSRKAENRVSTQRSQGSQTLSTRPTLRPTTSVGRCSFHPSRAFCTEMRGTARVMLHGMASDWQRRPGRTARTTNRHEPRRAGPTKAWHAS